jgi:predicted MFS family arabinose efflux permease
VVTAEPEFAGLPGGRGDTAAIVFVATGVQTLGAVVATSLAVFGPVLIAELAIGPADLGLLVGAMNVGALPGLVLGPAIGDRWGASRSLAGSSVVSAAALAFVVLVPGFAAMLAGVTVAGAGWGLAALSGGGAIFDRAPFRRRGLLISIRQLSLPLGGAIAGVLAPFVGIVGYRAMFGIQAVAFLVLGLLAMRLPMEMSRRTSSPWRSDPPVRAFRLGILSVAMTIGQWAFIVYLTIELTSRLGFPFALAAVVFLGTQISGAVGRVGLGVMSDRLGPPRTPLLALSTGLSAALVLAFGLIGPDAPAVVVTLIALGAAFFVIGWNGVFVVALAEAGRLEHVNMNLGTGLTMMRIGNIVAPPMFGIVLALTMSSIAWAIVAAILGLAAIGFVLVGPGPIEPEDSATVDDHVAHPAGEPIGRATPRPIPTER